MLSTLVCALTLLAPSSDWPSFRGPRASGIAEGYPTPLTWNVEKGEKLLWKTAIPGLSHSSPVVWGDKLFVATAITSGAKVGVKIGLYGSGDPAPDDEKHDWKVFCLDKKSGKVLWEKTSHTGIPKIHRHTKATHANTTISVDGKRLVAFFGSEGLYCYDLSGKLLWQKDLGVLDSGPYDAPSLQWGFASSPILHKDRVYVQCDVLTNPFLACFDAKSGKQIWRTVRDDVAAWSTPAIAEDGGRTLLIVNGWKHIGGYDAATGKEIWRLKGGGDIPVPTPLVSDGLIYITNAHGRTAPVYAVKLDAKGDITPKDSEESSSGIAWLTRRDGSYMQTPLCYKGYLTVCRDNGLLSCYEAKTGKRVYQERLGTGRTAFTASGVAANGRLHYTSEEGDVFVLQAGPEFKLLATNPLGEVCLSTPAVSEGVFYFHTSGNIVAVGGK